MKLKIALAAFAATCLGNSTTASASTDVNGLVAGLFHWEGIHGALVKLDQQMIDPENCGRSDQYIIPDSSTHAQFVQAMLLSAQSTQRRVYINLNGCLDGFPIIRAVNNAI